MRKQDTVATQKLLRSVVWRRLDRVGLENCRLWKVPLDKVLKGKPAKGLVDYGFRLEGTVFITEKGKPYEVRYEVVCNENWETQIARIAVGGGASMKDTELRRDEHDHWKRDGKRLEAFDGLIDVDLAFTPATNTLPIRRLALKVGSQADVTTAWVKFPDLTVEPLRQRYMRRHPKQYRYESSTGFAANLDVDELGLIVRYGEVWERASE